MVSQIIKKKRNIFHSVNSIVPMVIGYVKIPLTKLNTGSQTLKILSVKLIRR